MACGDVLSLEDLQTAKKHQIFEAEVITGKAGGVAGGASIGTATNPVTGQTQQTLPSILADLGFDVQSWTSSTGGVLASANQVFLNDTPGSLGLGDYYAWGGTFPKTVPAGTDPALVGSGYIMRSSRLAGVQAREALRRSYAEAGYNLVDGSFEAGGTLVNANDVLLHEASGKAFSGPAGTVAAGTNPSSGWFVDRSKSTQIVRTSHFPSLSSTLDMAIFIGADVLIDNAQNITSPITKSLNGKSIKITSTPEGWVNFTPTQTDVYYPVITLNGTGVESVLTMIKLDGGKVRGVGRAVVGCVVNNVYMHCDGSEMRNVSACVNTVTAKFHFCYQARYYNVFQQLASQDWEPGVYGYGTVPIDCEYFGVDSCQIGLPGQPVDRHAVYGSSFDDGSGFNRVGFVSKNKVIMRDYRSETPETTFERAFKFVGTKSVHLDDNDLDGGYGFALFTCRKHQTADSLRITNNRGRFFADAVLVTSQDAAADEPDATWYLDELVLGDENVFRSQTTTSGISAGVRYKNIKKITDSGTRYYNEAYATSKALSIYIGTSDRVRADILDSRGCYYDKFQNIFRGEEPVNLFIDILAMRPDSASSPSVATTTATGRKIHVESIDKTAAWKSGLPGVSVLGFGYVDPYFKRTIYNDGAGVWVDEAGLQVAGLSTARPLSVPVGHIFYQVDSSNYVRWTGNKWVLVTVAWTGIPTFGTTAQINAINKALLGYGHMVYNSDTKKPAFFDDLAQAWKYADGAPI